MVGGGGGMGWPLLPTEDRTAVDPGEAPRPLGRPRVQMTDGGRPRDGKTSDEMKEEWVALAQSCCDSRLTEFAAFADDDPKIGGLVVVVQHPSEKREGGVETQRSGSLPSRWGWTTEEGGKDECNATSTLGCLLSGPHV